jgi:hypothetical protein
VSTSGQTIAISTACCSIQVLPPPGISYPNNSRAAVPVDEIGFQAAIVPSQPGMVAVGTKVLGRGAHRTVSGAGPATCAPYRAKADGSG